MKSPDTPDADERSSPAPTRKAYQKPQLQIYGDLAEITQSQTTLANSDGGTHPNKRHTN
jgi:hypothetical protein